MAMQMQEPNKPISSGSSNGGPLKTILYSALGILFVGFVLLTAEKGAVSPIIANPAGVGVDPPIAPLFAAVDWLFVSQLLAVIFAICTVFGFIWGWRRYPRHPFLLMVLASNSIIWLDPFNNWALYLIYNPDLWHFPQDWPLISLSPISEPLILFVYAPYVLLPYVVAIRILKRMQAKRSIDSFVWRHPFVSLGLITFIVGFIWDASQEVFMVSTQVFTYSHIIPFGSIWVGKFNQYPILLASGLITIVMIPAALLLYRDDTGRTQAEKLAQRFKLFRNRPATATFLVMAAVLHLSFMSFISVFYFIRVNHLATSVACPWPYPSTKVFDPNGFYEREGQPGPFWEGRMSTWMAGQVDGRPENILPISDRCSPRDWNNP